MSILRRSPYFFPVMMSVALCVILGSPRHSSADYDTWKEQKTIEDAARRRREYDQAVEAEYQSRYRRESRSSRRLSAEDMVIGYVCFLVLAVFGYAVHKEKKRAAQKVKKRDGGIAGPIVDSVVTKPDLKPSSALMASDSQTPHTTATDKLLGLGRMLDAGLITREEFETQKNALLAGSDDESKE